jgi:hypothetical protein
MGPVFASHTLLPDDDDYDGDLDDDFEDEDDDEDDDEEDDEAEGGYRLARRHRGGASERKSSAPAWRTGAGTRRSPASVTSVLRGPTSGPVQFIYVR